MLRRNPDAQRGRPAHEPKGRIEDERLPVDANRNRPGRGDLDRGRRPLRSSGLHCRTAPTRRSRARRRRGAAVSRIRRRFQVDRCCSRPGSRPPHGARRRRGRASPVRSSRRWAGSRGRRAWCRASSAASRPGSPRAGRPRRRAERGVVDEDAAVDLGEVDRRSPPVDEGVEGADDVVAVDPEIEREVVAGTGRDAREGQVVLGCDRGDERLRAVAARGRERIGPGATASRTSCSRSSPGFSSIGSIPRARASSGRLLLTALPPPDLGFHTTIARFGGSAAGSATRTVKARPARPRLATRSPPPRGRRRTGHP